MPRVAAWALPTTHPGAGVYLTDPPCLAPQSRHQLTAADWHAGHLPASESHSLPSVTSQNRIKPWFPLFSPPLLSQQIPREVAQFTFFLSCYTWNIVLPLHILTDEVRAELQAQWSWLSFPQTCCEESSFFSCASVFSTLNRDICKSWLVFLLLTSDFLRKIFQLPA